VATAGLATTAAAQTNDEIFPNLQWNFSTPGARANGMGRTFIGLADDATAAITNPAGLLSLTRPQVYLEFKNNVEGRPAREQNVVALQPTIEATVNSLSFLSVSAPINDRIAAGFSLHRLLDHEENILLDARGIPDTTLAFRPVVATADFAVTSFEGSVAFMVTNALRVGTTIGVARLEADTEATRGSIIFGPRFPGDPSDLQASPIIANRTSIHDSQMAMLAAVGVLYRINDVVNIGADFTKPRFNTQENLQTNPGFPTTNAATLITEPGFPKGVEINVPNHFGVGVAVRPIPKLLIAADAVRTIRSLTENTTIIFEGEGLTSSSHTTASTFRNSTLAPNTTCST
jgi:long-subunit fatty acid transport protein